MTNGETDFESWVENALKVLIVYSVSMYIFEIDLEKSPDSTQGHYFWLWSERIVGALFTIEFLGRWKRRGYVYLRSGLGFLDLMAVIPFWLGFLLPVPALHYVRTLRVLRMLKFYRYSAGMRAFVAGLVKARDRLGGMGLVVLILVLFSAVGMYEIEGSTQPEVFGTLAGSIWWTTVTLTTVGYGDAYPLTTAGRLFAQGIMMLGLGVTASFIGIVGSSVYDELISQKVDAARLD